MKLSEDTINILKNFSTINPEFLFYPGSLQRTQNWNKTILAAAQFKEEFPRKAAIHSLPRFLATLSLFDDPEIEFEEKFAIISSGRSKLRYTFAAPSLIVEPLAGAQPHEPEVTVALKWSDFQSVIRAAGVLQLPNISFEGEDGKVYMRATGPKPSDDIFGVEVGETDLVFKAIFKTENIKVIPADYEVQISSSGSAYFKSEDRNVAYWNVMEANSNF